MTSNMFAVTAAFKLFNDSSVIRAIGAQLALINSIGSTIAEGLGRLHDRRLPVTRIREPSKAPRSRQGLVAVRKKVEEPRSETQRLEGRVTAGHPLAIWTPAASKKSTECRIDTGR